MSLHYRTTLQKRFRAGDVPYVYATTSASILRLDEITDSILRGFDTATGVDPATYLEAVADADREEVAGALDELVSLGLILPVGSEPVLRAAPASPSYPLQTLVLNVTNKCNLSCTYCYEYGEDKLTVAPKPGERARAPMMTPAVARESVEFLFANAAGKGPITITFFGGETLLNFDVIRGAVARAKELAETHARPVGFALTTNASLLTPEVIAFLIEHQFGVNISIDGNREQHDQHRKFKSGRGSYDEILPRIHALLAARRPGGRPIGARVTLTAGRSEVLSIYRHLVDELGFDEVGFAPVTAAPGREYALSSANYSEVLAAFRVLAEDWSAAALRDEKHGFSNLNDLVRELHLGVNKAHPCGAGLGLLGVSTEGDLGLCHRFVESGKHEIGHVHTGVDEPKRSEFLARGHISAKPDCHSCFARPVCSGGCYHEAYVRTHDETSPNLHLCDWIRAWTELGLEVYGRVHSLNPSYLDRLTGHDERSGLPRAESAVPMMERM